MNINEIYNLGSLFFEIFSEGYSIKYKKYLYEIFDFKSYKLFEIELYINEKINSKKKIFYYWINGRNKKLEYWKN